jgi:hypothetical protein
VLLTLALTMIVRQLSTAMMSSLAIELSATMKLSAMMLTLSLRGG